MGLTDLIRRGRATPAGEARSILASGIIGPEGLSFGSTSSGAPVEWDDVPGLKTSAIVRRCVNMTAQTLSRLDFTVMRGEEVDPAHPFAVLMNKGNPSSPFSARMVKEVAFARLEWRGQAFLYLDRGDSGTGPVQNVVPIFNRCRPVIDKNDRGEEVLAGFQLRREGQNVGLLPSEVLWLRYPDPETPWGAVAPWQSAEWAARIDRRAQGWQEGEMVNGNRAAAVVYLGDLDPAEHDRAVATWRSTMEGPQSAARAFLTSGPTQAKVDRLGMTAQEVAYLDSRRFNWEEVALAFGIDRDLLFGQSTFENKAAGRSAWWEDTLLPKLEVVASEVDRQVLPGAAEEAGWDVSRVEALRESEDALVQRVVTLLNADAILVNEGRQRLGLDPLPGGDVTLTTWRGSAGSDPLAGQSQDSAATRVAVVTRSGLHRLERRHAARPRVEVRATSTSRRDPAEVRKVYDRLEARGREAVARLADAQERVVLKAFGKATRSLAAGAEVRVSASEFYDEHYWMQRTRDALEPWITDVWEEGAHRTAGTLGLSFDLFSPRVTQHLRSRLDVLAGQVTATTRAAIDSGVLEVAAEEGMSVDDTARLLRQVFTDLSGWRAETIARTETVGGFNGASRDVALQAPGVVGRRWLAAHDERVRPSHQRLDGHTTSSMDEPYPNGLMFPGDPSGPPRETINCRCVEEYVMEGE